MDLSENDCSILLVKTTERSFSIANKLAKKLLENNLAACISLKNITSMFFWEGQLEESSEIEITIKTIPKLKEKVFKFIRDNHTYQLPELISFQVSSTKEYAKWLENSIN